jgi:hypothetical protein
MLDQLDRLDDMTPPKADDAMLSRVRSRAGRLRTRNRLTSAAAIGVVIAIAAGIAVLSSRPTVVTVTGPAPRTSVPTATSGPTSSRALPSDLHIVMTLDAPTVQLGSDIRATVVVTNDTGRTKSIGTADIECALGIGPELYDAAGKFPADKPPLSSSTRCPLVSFPPGKTVTFEISLPTHRVGLKKGARHGDYTVTLVNTLNSPANGPQSQRFKLKPVPVRIVKPDLTARLEISRPVVAAGGEVTGFVVFDNAGHSPTSAGCATAPDYEIFLESAGALITTPATRQLNPSAPCAASELLLEPGITRVPFTVPAKYRACDARPPLDYSALPLCAGTGPVRKFVPNLPGGRYEVVFGGAGALGSVEVVPGQILITGAA